MVLIPPTDADSQKTPQPPAPTPVASDAPPAEGQTDSIQRKIAVAQGKGFVRTSAPTVYQETGEEITLRGDQGQPVPCRYCGANPCTGPNWIFEGVSIFRCNSCGKKQKMGVTQALSDQNKAEVDMIQNVDKVRNRAWRDDDARREEQRLRNLDAMAINPNRPPIDPRFVSKTFFD